MAVLFDNEESQSASIREYIKEGIKNLSPVDRPVMAALEEESGIDNTTVSGIEDTLDTPSATNAVLAGDTVTIALADTKVRTKWTNYVQELEKKYGVDLTMNDMNKVGIGRGDRSEYDYQKDRKFDAIMNDAEATLVSNTTGVAPLTNTGTTGYCAGIEKKISTNAIVAGSGVYENTLNKSMYNALSQLCYAQGGKPNKVFLGAQAKDAVASWVQNVTRTISDAGKTLTDVVDQVRTTTGDQDLILERNLKSVVLMLETQYWKIGWMKKPYFRDLGITGDFDAGYWRTRLTLLPLAEKSSGKITGFNYAI